MESMPMDTPKNSQRMINEIVYLASLVSNPQVIDPLLDEVRSITAAMPSAEYQLGDHDQKSLEHVRDTLVDHLVHRDALRVFTLDELQGRLAENIGSDKQPPRRLQTLREVGYILCLTILSFGAGVAVMAGLPLQQRLLIAPAFSLATLHMGIAWLSWSGLRSFNSKLRRAYAWICIAYLITGAGVMLSPFPHVFLDSLIFRYGMIMPIFVPASILFYLGTQIFARTVGVSSWAVSRRLVFGLSTLIAVIALLLPHPTQEPSEWYFHLFLASTLANIVLTVFTALAAYQISRNVGAMYARAMRWFSVTMGVLAVPLLIYSILGYFEGRIAGVTFTIASTIFSVPGILMLLSAYKFKRSGGNT